MIRNRLLAEERRLARIEAQKGSMQRETDTNEMTEEQRDTDTNEMTEEQREKMIDNRLLAEERRLARMKAQEEELTQQETNMDETVIS